MKSIYVITHVQTYKMLQDVSVCIVGTYSNLDYANNVLKGMVEEESQKGCTLLGDGWKTGSHIGERLHHAVLGNELGNLIKISIDEIKLHS